MRSLVRVWQILIVFIQVVVSQYGHVDAIKALIEGGVNVNYAVLAGSGVHLEAVGIIALMCACAKGVKEAVKALMDAGRKELLT